jgi:hypothetical protein
MIRFCQRRTGLFVALASLSLAAYGLAAQGFPGASLKADSGKFEISVNGQKIGSEDFSLAQQGKEWVARGNTEVHTASGNAHVTGELHLTPSGAPVKYVWIADTGHKVSSTTTFDGTVAKMSTDIGKEKPFEQSFQFTAPVVVLDNNLYDQYCVLAQLYDWSARGVQNFPVLIPQDRSPGSISVEAISQNELRMKTSDLELTVHVDSAHRVMRISVPSSKAEIVRK